jgi:hypothetical protein
MKEPTVQEDEKPKRRFMNERRTTIMNIDIRDRLFSADALPLLKQQERQSNRTTAAGSGESEEFFEDDYSCLEDDASDCSELSHFSECYDIWGSTPGGAPARMNGSVLTKEPGRFRPWHHRYITLESGVLRYYKYRGAPRPRRIFNLHSDKAEFSYNSAMGTLKLYFAKSDRVIKFQPDPETSGPSFKAWKEAVKEHIRFVEVHDENRDVGLDTPTMPASMHGVLEKRSPKPNQCGFQFWQTRYCVLEKGVLMYKYSANEQARGHLNFHKLDAEFCCDTTKRLIRIDTPNRIYQLKVPPEENIQKWHTAFKDHIKYGKQSRKASVSAKWKYATNNAYQKKA